MICVEGGEGLVERMFVVSEHGLLEESYRGVVMLHGCTRYKVGNLSFGLASRCLRVLGNEGEVGISDIII